MSLRYTAVVLDEESVQKLRDAFAHLMDWKLLPVGFRWQTESGEPLPHHMTLNLGAAPDPTRLGKEVELLVTGWAVDEKCLAVRVEFDGVDGVVASGNPHVTLAVNPTTGGKPKDSLSLTNWISMTPKGLTLWGTVQEVR